MLEKVVSAAPEFARAWAMVAWHRAFFLRNFDVKCIPGLNQSSVIAAADNALRLDPGAGDERALYEYACTLEETGRRIESRFFGMTSPLVGPTPHCGCLLYTSDAADE